jgi:hypothetical protein
MSIPNAFRSDRGSAQGQGRLHLSITGVRALKSYDRGVRTVASAEPVRREAAAGALNLGGTEAVQTQTRQHLRAHPD